MASSYFSHDSNARNSKKLLRLRQAHGAAGYGVYFMLLERLREEGDYTSDRDYDIIAYDLREDKALIKSLWDFQYSWEIYTPVVKRKYGYYTLPILFGDKFVGRIETVADRKESVLRVKDVWWEEGIRQTKKLESALDKAVKTISKFNECKEIVW